MDLGGYRKMTLNAGGLTRIVVLAAAALAGPATAAAHCDTMNGPVVAAARAALAKRDITPVLKWVRQEHEPELRSAFARALKVREAGPEATQLADTYFFETAVRLHRAGEGAPYTGLKLYGTDPAIAGADAALEKGSVEDLVRKAQAEVEAGIRQRFERAFVSRKSADSGVAAGREYVAAYVEFLHYIEGLHTAVSGQHAEAESKVR
jgi:hypothetical protein